MVQNRLENHTENFPQSAELVRLILAIGKDYAILLTERLFDYPANEIVGQSVAVIFAPEEAALNAPAKDRETAARTGWLEVKRWYQHRDGSGFRAILMMMPLRHGNGGLRGFAQIIRDEPAQKLAEDESSQFLSSITDSFYRFDRDLRYTYVNRATTEMFGLPEKDFLGKTLWELFPDAAGNKFHREALHALKEQETIIFENYYAPLNRWFENHIYPSGDGLAVFTTEITGRKRSETALREAEERYRALVEATATTVWHATPEGALSFVGDSWTEVSGQTVEEILKWGWLEAVHPDDREPTVELWQTALRAKTIYAAEFRILTVEGKYKWFAASAVPVFDTAGNIREWVGINIDIDAEREAEAKIRASEQEFSVLAETVPQLVWMAEADGFIFWYNRNWYDYTGTTPEAMAGWGWQSVHDPEMLPPVIEKWKASIASGEPFEMEFPLKGADGKFRWFLTRVNPLRDAAGKIFRWFGTNTDIDEQRRLDQRNRFIIALDEAVRPLTTPEEITLTLARRLGEYLGVDRCAYAEVEADEDHFTIPGDYTKGATISIVGYYRMADFGAEVLRLMRENKPYIVNDVNTDPQVTEADLAAYRLTTIQAVICVPLHKNGRFNACMAVHQKIPRRWTTEEIELVQFVANRFWESIERARTNAYLRESEKRFRHLADNAPVMIWVTEADGNCTYLSQSWYDFTGQTPETSLGFGWINATHPDDQQRARDTFLATNEKRGVFRIEYRLRRKDGSYAWAIVSAQPRKSETGDFLGYVGSVFDITERKKNEEILLERARLATLSGDIGNVLVQPDNLPNLLHRCTESLVKHLDAAFVRIWTLDDREQTLILSASAGIYTHLDGFHSRIPVGKFKIGLIAETRQPLLTNDVAHDPRIDPQWAQREGLRAFAGYPLIVEKRLVGVMGIFSKLPITTLTLEALEPISKGIANGIERKQVEEERRQLLHREQDARQTAENANRLKDEFLATLSHELRTPLNAILGWSQVLQNHQLDESERVKALSTIQRNVRSQSQLIDDILDVSRIITGKLRLDVRAVDLAGVISAAVDTARPAAEAKTIRLQTLLDPQAGPISGDPDRLQQVVWNLLSNAIKFTPKNGRVQVRLERVNSHVEIVVSDTGKGIEPDFLPHVFERFRQSDGSMTRRHGGLGLGLAIVRQIIELHGGTVAVESAGENKGATFTINLPLMPLRREPAGGFPREHPAAQSVESLTGFSPELQDVRVLIVEDEADSRELLAYMLVSSGAEVAAAGSAGEALENLRREKFDVVISDLGMPEEDGFALIGKIRELPPEQGGAVPAIALTAYARAEDRVKALRSGFQMHIAKPVEPAELLAVVANLAGRIKNRRQ